MAGLCWRGGYQRQARHGPYLQVELGHVAGVQGVVAAVVGPRGHFIDHQRTQVAAVVHHKILHTQHAHVLELVRNRFGGRDGLFTQRIREVALKHLGHGQDARSVQVALRRKMHHLPIGPTRHDDRQLGFER